MAMAHNTVEDAQRIVLGYVDRLPPTELPIAKTAGHILAQDVAART